MQLYVDRNRPKTEKLLGVINGFEGMKGIFVTVDAAAPGKREADERSRAEIEVVSRPGRWAVVQIQVVRLVSLAI
jgi:L-lactate dehydrogenase (cytochrome)